MRRRRGTRAPCHRIGPNVTSTAPYALYASRGGGPGGLTIIAILDLLGGAAQCMVAAGPMHGIQLPATDTCKWMALYGGLNHLFESKKSVGVVFLHACARTDHSVSEIIIFKSAAGSISFRSTVSQSCSIHACVGGLRPRGGRASAVTMAMPAAGCCLPCATSGGHPTRHSGVP